MRISEFINTLEGRFSSIKKEYDAVITEGLYTSWPEKFLYNDGWNVFGLRFQGTDIPDAHAICPTLSSFIKKYDTILPTVGFSMLKPGTHILPHIGYTDKVLRCHLGISIPDGDNCLRVGDKILKWKEGRAFVFDDTIEHEAWNNTNEARVVLLLDIDKAGLKE